MEPKIIPASVDSNISSVGFINIPGRIFSNYIKRNFNGRSVTDISEKMGITTSYLRLLLSGGSNFTTSQFFPIVDTFGFDQTNLARLLLLIQNFESALKLNSYFEFTEKIKALTHYDGYSAFTNYICTIFDEIDKLIGDRKLNNLTTSIKQNIKSIVQSFCDSESSSEKIDLFLKYNSFNEGIESMPMQENLLKDTFKTIPCIYNELFIDELMNVTKSITSLSEINPMIDIYFWEERNKDGIKNVWNVFTNRYNIIGYEHYDYTYFLNNTFEEYITIFIEEDANDIKAIVDEVLPFFAKNIIINNPKQFPNREKEVAQLITKIKKKVKLYTIKQADFEKDFVYWFEGYFEKMFAGRTPSKWIEDIRKSEKTTHELLVYRMHIEKYGIYYGFLTEGRNEHKDNRGDHQFFFPMSNANSEEAKIKLENYIKKLEK